MIPAPAAKDRRFPGNSATRASLSCCGTTRPEGKRRTSDPLPQSIVPADRAARAANEPGPATAPAATFLLAIGRVTLFLRRVPRYVSEKHFLPVQPRPESALLVSTAVLSAD